MRPMFLVLSSIATLAFAPSALAGQTKADVCHWTAAGFYNLLNVSVTSAHFNPSVHPLDVVPGTLFVDGDGDGFGDPDSPVYGCPGPGLVDNDDDCDDSDASLGDVCGTDFDGLFGLVSGEIVQIDTTTGLASPYLSPALTSDSYHLTWNPNTAEFYVVENVFVAPRLVTVDACTGAVLADVPLVTGGGTNAFLCEGLDYDQYNDRLVGSCSLDAGLPSDPISESVVEIDIATGGLTVLAVSPPTVLDNEFDLLVFVGDEARAIDGRGQVTNTRWFTVDSTTWATAVSSGPSTPFGVVAWDWLLGELYSVSHTTTSTPFVLQIQDVDNRSIVANIGNTGLTSNPRGLTFADFSCP